MPSVNNLSGLMQDEQRDIYVNCGFGGVVEGEAGAGAGASRTVL
jgi:hypothetical protein